jgi:hypothetical protein
MKLNEVFPGRYLKHDDLGGRDVRVTMDFAELREMQGQDGEKRVLYFQGRTRGLVLNKTNAGAIADAYGDEMDDWAGKDIVLFCDKTQFGGKQVPCIRVRIPASAMEAAPAAEPVPAGVGALPADDVPF